MRKIIILVAAVAATFFTPAAASAAPTGNFNEGQPHSCTFGTSDTDTDLQNQEVVCTGTISGLGNNPVPVYVVTNANAGCRNPGNEDIPGQRRFISGPFTPDANGSVDYTAVGEINCHGNQEAFIANNLTLEAYVCESGRPRFDKRGNQTNSGCSLIDTRSETVTG